MSRSTACTCLTSTPSPGVGLGPTWWGWSPATSSTTTTTRSGCRRYGVLFQEEFHWVGLWRFSTDAKSLWPLPRSTVEWAVTAFLLDVLQDKRQCETTVCGGQVAGGSLTRRPKGSFAPPGLGRLINKDVIPLVQIPHHTRCVSAFYLQPHSQVEEPRSKWNTSRQLVEENADGFSPFILRGSSLSSAGLCSERRLVRFSTASTPPSPTFQPQSTPICSTTTPLPSTTLCHVPSGRSVSDGWSSRAPTAMEVGWWCGVWHHINIWFLKMGNFLATPSLFMCLVTRAIGWITRIISKNSRVNSLSGCFIKSNMLWSCKVEMKKQ